MRMAHLWQDDDGDDDAQTDIARERECARCGQLRPQHTSRTERPLAKLARFAAQKYLYVYFERRQPNVDLLQGNDEPVY